MAVSLVVAVTDEDWFNLLRERGDIDEVNFWSPSPRAFRALELGELFLFKLHSPKNFIVGGGVFTAAHELPCSLAWETFGIKNGAHSLTEMRQRIKKYRAASSIGRDDFSIGCRILTQPFFWDESDWIPVPSDWSPNIVSFKTYNTVTPEGLKLWDTIEKRMHISGTNALHEERVRYGAPQLIKPRLGQGAFRTLVTEIYERKCAVTGERTLPALDAAHIKPYGEGGRHAGDNGLLLRRDLHSLFDAGYVSVDKGIRFIVSSRIKENFDNGKDYYALHGRSLMSPTRSEHRPNSDYINWHNEHRYLG